MIVDRDAPDDVCARVQEMVGRTDPILRQIDRLLEDDPCSSRSKPN